MWEDSMNSQTTTSEAPPFQPSEDRVLVEVVIKTKTGSGLMIPAQHAKNAQRDVKFGRILAVGPGALELHAGPAGSTWIRRPMKSKVGMECWFDQYAAPKLELEQYKHDERELRVVREADILGYRVE